MAAADPCKNRRLVVAHWRERPVPRWENLKLSGDTIFPNRYIDKTLLLKPSLEGYSSLLIMLEQKFLA